MKPTIIVGALFVLATPISALANDVHQKIAAAADQTNVASLTEGEVRKVDKDAKKITIRHSAIQNLEMPAMTMVFQVKDPAMLDQVKAGDKIRFEAEKVSGQFTVTRIESSK